MANDFLAEKLNEAKETVRQAEEERRQQGEKYQQRIEEEERFKTRVAAANDKALATAGFAGLNMVERKASFDGNYNYKYKTYTHISSHLIPLGLVDANEESGRTHGFARVIVRDRTFERTFRRTWIGVERKVDDHTRVQSGFEVKLIAGTENGDDLFLIDSANTYGIDRSGSWHNDEILRRAQLEKAEQFIDIAYAAVTNTETSEQATA